MSITASAITPDNSLEEFRVEFNKLIQDFDGVASGNTFTQSIIFEGATADAFTLFERLEAKLEQYPAQLTRACVELAKDWGTDRYLRRLEAMMAVSDAETSLMLTGNGDVLEPEDGLIGLGSGGAYALAAARALMDIEGIDAETVARKAMSIAATICVYTNENVVVETINSELGSS